MMLVNHALVSISVQHFGDDVITWFYKPRLFLKPASVSEFFISAQTSKDF